MLPVVAFPFEDFYIDTHHLTHQLEPREQQILFYTGLLSATLGIGGIRAILCPMGAYSLQGYNQHQLLSFFNWWVVPSFEYSQSLVWPIIRLRIDQLYCYVQSSNLNVHKYYTHFITNG